MVLINVKKNFLTAVAAAVLSFAAAAACQTRVANTPAVIKPDANFLQLASSGDSFAIAHATVSACAKASDKTNCYTEFLMVPASDRRVKIAMGALDAMGAKDADIKRDGHVYAHAIGIAAAKGAKDVEQPFRECSEAYQSGCYHGVIQAWFAQLDKIEGPETNALCEPFRKSESERWIRFQCVHGMGHGLMMLYDHDLNKGLAGCDLLSDWWDRQSCYGGAFMENIVNVTNPHHPASMLEHHGSMAGMEDMPGMNHENATKFKAVDPNNQQYPCSIMPERYLRSCYEMQTSVMLYNNNGNLAGAAKDCDSAPKEYKVTCFASLGRDISAYSEQNHAEAIKMCSSSNPKYLPYCYLGVVKNLIDLDARATSGLSFCRDIKDVNGKNVCYSAVGEQILILAPDESRRRELCSGAEADYLDACLYGARVTGVAVPTKLAEYWNSTK
jgi:hypothetical protein